MSKPNFIQKAAELLGFSSERVEKMTAEEKTKLESYGEKAANLESERDTAISEKDSAVARADKAEASLKAEQEKTKQLEASIKEKDTEIQSLNEKLEKLPGAESTSTQKKTEETIPGDKSKEKKIRSWERPLYNRY